MQITREQRTSLEDLLNTMLFDEEEESFSKRASEATGLSPDFCRHVNNQYWSTYRNKDTAHSSFIDLCLNSWEQEHGEEEPAPRIKFLAMNLHKVSAQPCPDLLSNPIKAVISYGCFLEVEGITIWWRVFLRSTKEETCYPEFELWKAQPVEEKDAILTEGEVLKFLEITMQDLRP